MEIELSPALPPEFGEQKFNATLFGRYGVVAEILDAPYDITRKWAEAMSQWAEAKIKRVGFCFYCGSIQRNGAYCGECNRVWRD